jgi:dihydroorotate dehydrogenase
LSPDFEDNNYKFVIPLAIENGIKIMNFGNTKRIEEPRLSQGFGGYSGPELFENTLNNVRRIRREFGNEVYIIATGGIDSPEKAYMLLIYADAASILTAFVKPDMSGLFLPNRINNYLLKNPSKG